MHNLIDGFLIWECNLNVYQNVLCLCLHLHISQQNNMWAHFVFQCLWVMAPVDINALFSQLEQGGGKNVIYILVG